MCSDLAWSTALLFLSSAVGLLRAQCDGECYLSSADAKKTPFAAFEEAELYGRCATLCAVEVGPTKTAISQLFSLTFSLQVLGSNHARVVSCVSICLSSHASSNSTGSSGRCVEISRDRWTRRNTQSK